MQEMLQVLADVTRHGILSQMRNSPYFSILIDETTDVAVEKQLIIFGRYITETKDVSQKNKLRININWNNMLIHSNAMPEKN